MPEVYPAVTSEERLLNLVLEEMKRLRDSQESLAAEVRKEFKELRADMHKKDVRDREELASLKTKMAVIVVVASAIMTGIAQWATGFFR